MKDFTEKVTKNKQTAKLISSYGESDFNNHIREYIRVSALRDRVVADLEKTIKEDNPDDSKMERRYKLSEQFDDLYADQIASLEVQIHLQ